MSLKSDTAIDKDTVTATIFNNASLSAAVDLGGLRLFGISMPAAWTAANLTFQTSEDGGTTFKDLYNSSGTEITVMVAANQNIVLDPVIWASVQRIKVRSGTSALPVPQGAARDIILVLRPV